MFGLYQIMPDYDGPIEYRALPHVANSDLKEIVMRHYGKTRPDNLEQVFEFGNLVDALITEPHKVDRTHPKYPIAKAMHDTLFRDQTVRQLLAAPDYRRQWEFYRLNVHGVRGGKCKTDGVSNKFDTIFELKGLTVSNQKQFEEAINHLDYDQAAAWYIDVAHKKQEIIVALSKTHSDRMFKCLIGRDHKFYKTGVEKIKNSVKIWKQNGYV